MRLVLPSFPSATRAPDGGPALAFGNIGARACHDRDIPFLRRLYRHLRADELARIPWSESQKRSFCNQQFDAQHTDYLRRFPAADYLMIVHRRDPIGRLYVDLSGAAVHVIEIGLLPAWRGQGIGSALLTALQARAGDGAVVLSVERHNFRALALYRRLGFVVTGEGETHLSLRWSVPPP